MVTALVSALSGCAVKHSVAMTGEISLRGKVLPIGGLKEKTMAAYTAGAKIVLVPEENRRDLEEIDALARDNLQFIFCRTAADVLENALLPAEKPTVQTESAEKQSAPLYIPQHPGNGTQIHI